jgi:hypothetical protein
VLPLLLFVPVEMHMDIQDIAQGFACPLSLLSPYFQVVPENIGSDRQWMLSSVLFVSCWSFGRVKNAGRTSDHVIYCILRISFSIVVFGCHIEAVNPPSAP